MQPIDLNDAVRRFFFKLRPDDAYTLDEVRRQFQMWSAKVYSCDPGEICLKAGMPAKEFAMVLSGLVNVTVPSEAGEDVLLRVVGPGEYLGLMNVFAPYDAYRHDVVAAEKSEIFFFKVDAVRKWRTDPHSQPLFNYLGRQISTVYSEALAKATILSGADIADRLLRYLAIRRKPGSHTVALPGTAGGLAQYLGVNRCALSRVIGHLRAEGKIDFKHNVFTIL